MHVSSSGNTKIIATYHERDAHTWLELALMTPLGYDGSITLFLSPEEVIALARNIYKVVTEKRGMQGTSLEQMELPPEMVIHVSGER
jgi:hypothetical protein